MNRTVVVGPAGWHHDRSAGSAGADVSGIYAAIVEYDTMRDAVVILEYDLLPAKRGGIGGKGLRSILTDNRDRRKVTCRIRW